MTNKRYSRFKSEITGLFCIADENHKETFCGMDNEYNCMRIVNILNQKEERIQKLEKENEKLKKALKELKEIGDYQAIRIQELEEENKQLRQGKYIYGIHGGSND